jgi:hypothetical protein
MSVITTCRRLRQEDQACQASLAYKIVRPYLKKEGRGRGGGRRVGGKIDC